MMDKETVIGIFTEVFSYMDDPDQAMKLTLDLAKKFDLDGGKPQPKVVKTTSETKTVRAATKPNDAPPEPRIGLRDILKHSKYNELYFAKEGHQVHLVKNADGVFASACQQKLTKERPCTVEEYEKKGRKVCSPCFTSCKKELLGIIRTGIGDGKTKSTQLTLPTIAPVIRLPSAKPSITSILDKAPTKVKDIAEKLVSLLNTTTPILTTTIKQNLDKAMKCKITSKEYDTTLDFLRRNHVIINNGPSNQFARYRLLLNRDQEELNALFPEVQ
jgi:hypothetical protein